MAFEVKKKYYEHFWGVCSIVSFVQDATRILSSLLHRHAMKKNATMMRERERTNQRNIEREQPNENEAVQVLAWKAN